MQERGRGVGSRVWIALMCVALIVIGCEIEETDLPARGVVRVIATDSASGEAITGAAVYMDNQLQNETTPAVFSNVVEGMHQIRVRPAPGSGYAEQAQSVDLVPPDTAQAHVEFPPPDTSIANNHQVWIEANEDGAVVLLNDQLSANTTPAYLVLSPGETFISLYAPGMRLMEPEFHLLDAQAGMLDTLTFSLEPADSGNQAGVLPVGFSLPSYTGTAFDGGPYSAAQYRGRVLLLNFWFADCEPCRDEFPALEQVYQEHRADGFRILALNAGYQNDDLGDFEDIRNIGLTFPLLYVENWQEIIFTQYEVGAFPTNILVGPDGVIEARFGATTYDDLKSRVEALLP